MKLSRNTSIIAVTCAVLIGITLSARGYMHDGAILLAVVSIFAFFYNMVYQYVRIESVSGNMPRSYLYALAFCVLAFGYISVVAYLVLGNSWMVLLGGYCLILGLILAQFSNQLLLKHIVRGRRWILDRASGDNR